MPSATCNGVELYHEVHGDGEPLLCVMGLGAQLREWARNVRAFAERHRTVIFDNRDVGRSGLVEADYETADMAADALALADHLELESFHLLGVSLGGAIAQALTLAAPERVKTLTLAVTWGVGGRWWRERSRMLWRAAPHMTPDELLDQLLMLNLEPSSYENDMMRDAARRRVRETPDPQRPDGFFRQAKAANRHDLRERLGELDLPVHVIGAERDALVPAWKTKELADLIPGARLTVVEGAAHGLNMERADEFNALVLGFLGEGADGVPDALGDARV